MSGLCLNLKIVIYNNSIFILLAFLIFTIGCTSEKKTIQTDVDTTLILDRALNCVQTDTSLSSLFAVQQLRIVRSPLLKNDYKLFKNGMPVIYTDIDSTNVKLRNWRDPKFYVNIVDFKIVSSNKANVSLIFKSSGQWLLIDLVKENNEWVVYSFKNRQI